MNDTQIRETIRQAMKDWDAATPEQRATSLASAEALASIARGFCKQCGRKKNRTQEGTIYCPSCVYKR